jgi:glycosyltransferase involved in cell wall biosynthesis
MSEIKNISFVIPCFNEVQTIRQIVDRINNTDFKYGKEIIIIDDFSTDGSRDLLYILNQEKTYNIKIIFNDKNFGKGYSIRQGVSKATGELIFIQDADLEYYPEDLLKVVNIFEKYNCDVVYGSRFSNSQVSRKIYFRHYLGNKFLTFLSNLLTDLNLNDIETGVKCFKASKIKAINLEENRFGFEPEVTAKLNNIRCKFFEINIRYDARSYEEGKKITWKDGIAAVWCILKYNIWKRS